MARNARRQFARRLRELREFELGEKLTQENVATAFSAIRSLSGAAVSTWENGENDKRPSDERILQYALLFSSPDNLKPEPHVPAESALDKVARQRFYELRRDLLRLREEADQEARAERSVGPVSALSNDMWHHDPADEIIVVTSEVPDEKLPPIAHADNVNYTRLARYGHLDAFFELYVRLAELGYQYRRHRSAEERGIDPAHNLVLVGGPSRNRLTRNFLQMLDVPVEQRIDADGRPEVFVLPNGDEVRPMMIDFADGEQEIIEDVGLFVRATNPTNPDTDVTVCSGCYTAGVLGAVRTFTSPATTALNLEVVRSRIGRISNFYVLFKVPVVNGRVPPPRLESALIDCGTLD